MQLPKDDKERLARITDFLQSEIKDLKANLLKTEYKAYASDSDIRRNLERCIENIVNASLDAAKIILVAAALPIPESYRGYFLSAYSAGFVDKETGDTLADGAALRNILARQYLDIRWERISKFLSSDHKAYERFLDYIRN